MKFNCIPRYAFFLGIVGFPAVSSSHSPHELEVLKKQAADLMKRIEAYEKAMGESEHQKKPVQPVHHPVSARKKVAQHHHAALPVGRFEAMGLEKRVSVLEKENQNLKKDLGQHKENALYTGDFDGSFKVSGTNTSIGLNGFIKTDLMHDTTGAQTGYAYDFLLASFIPVESPANVLRSGQTHFSARYSRFALQTETPTSYGKLNTYLEADFFGNAPSNAEAYNNNYDLRLRHAYVNWGRFLIGQTTTTFHDPHTLPECLNPGAASSIGANRQPMIRYTHPFEDNDQFSLAIALENAETDYIDQTAITKFSYSLNGAANPNTSGGLDRLPDAVTRLYINRSWGGLSLRGLLRELRVKNGAKPEITKLGYGIGFSGYLLTVGEDSLVWQVQGGKGIGRYMLDSAGYAAFYNESTNRLSPQTSYGGYIGYKHYWVENFHSSLVGGFTKIQNDAFLRALKNLAVNSKMYSASVNFIYTPIKDMVSVGFEVIRARRILEDRRSGNMTRFQFSLTCQFGKPHKKHKDSGGV
jgi:hypothetical protein